MITLKCVWLILAIACSSKLAWADATPTYIRFPGWCVTSSEDFEPGRKYTRYPIAHALDGDSRTAWVFSARGSWKYDELPQYWLEFQPEEPRWVDTVWIMNGYNKSARTFQRNNRVIRIAVWSDRRKIKETDLTDRMGWHRVILPRVKTKSLRVEFLGMKRGGDNDLCISEIRLAAHNRFLKWQLPKVITYFEGSGSG